MYNIYTSIQGIASSKGYIANMLAQGPPWRGIYIHICTYIHLNTLTLTHIYTHTRTLAHPHKKQGITSKGDLSGIIVEGPSGCGTLRVTVHEVRAVTVSGQEALETRRQLHRLPQRLEK